jgi:hypothetical protein
MCRLADAPFPTGAYRGLRLLHASTPSNSKGGGNEGSNSRVIRVAAGVPVYHDGMGFAQRMELGAEISATTDNRNSQKFAQPRSYADEHYSYVQDRLVLIVHKNQ